MTSNQRKEKLYKTMYVIRQFEEMLLDLFSKGKLSGTTHVSIGQEAIAAAVGINIKKDDIMFSSHRCHGHFISYGGDIGRLLAEVMGKEDGVCSGRGGSQHLQFENFYSNGIQGGIVGNAVGAALAEKQNFSDRITVVFLGDGTLGEGLVYESLNFCSLLSLPVLFVLENNCYAQSTPVQNAVSGDIASRAKAFGIKTDEITTNDVFLLDDIFKERVSYVRSKKTPFFQIVNTYRLGPHSKGDDFRDQVEIDSWKKKDPILLARRNIDHEKLELIHREVQVTMKDVYTFAENSLFAIIEKFNCSVEDTILDKQGSKKYKAPFIENEKISFVASINHCLNTILEENKDTFIIGEDLIDPYGGAFKVTKGLSTKFPKQVISTPISEAGIVAWATGAALRGKRPIAEIMFGDFLLLASDQIVNHACKYEWMYNDQVTVPLVIRTPMGGGRGYGPTHSQSLEKMFLGVSGLTIVAPSNLLSPGELLKRATNEIDSPVLFIENKALYGKSVICYKNGRLGDFFVKSTDSLFPTLHLSLTEFTDSDISLLCYGGNTNLAIEVAKKLLIEYEIVVDIVVPSLISPVPCNEIINFIASAKKIATLEETSKRGGWGAELIACINEVENNKQKKYLRIGASDVPIPAGRELEKYILPNRETICDKLRSFVDG